MKPKTPVPIADVPKMVNPSKNQNKAQPDLLVVPILTSVVVETKKNASPLNWGDVIVYFAQPLCAAVSLWTKSWSRDPRRLFAPVNGNESSKRH
jgi:hypothetical protein